MDLDYDTNENKLYLKKVSFLEVAPGITLWVGLLKYELLFRGGIKEKYIKQFHSSEFK